MNKHIKQLLIAFLITVLTLTSGCVYLETGTQTTFTGGDCVMYFPDVGNADSCLIKCDGEYMLIDGGNNNDGDMLCSLLEKNDVSYLKYIVATHPHEDHIGGLDDVIYDTDVGTVIIPDCDHTASDARNLIGAAVTCNVPREYAQVGNTYSLGEGSFEILGPTEITDDMNGNSIVLRFDYQGRSALFTGDSERTEEEKMLDLGLISDIDILKVGHHGSREASSYHFLWETMPEYAIITTGEDNSYGHPHEEALSRLEDCGAMIYRTDEMGGIRVSIADGAITVDTDIEADIGQPVDKQESNDTNAEYIGNRKSRVYHTDSCPNLPSEKNRVYFSSKEEAESKHYKVCGNCNP